MIGNDIVDREQAKQESNWQRRGFLDKVFTTHEQQLIHTANDPECMVWTLWSMKESAYKARIRETERRVFNPKKISCTLTALTGEIAEGIVFYERRYRTVSSITSPYIASVALPTSDFGRLQQEIVPFETTSHLHQSATIRAGIAMRFAIDLSIQAKDIRIDKNLHGIPTVVVNGHLDRPLHVPITISHHGLYGAYGFYYTEALEHHLRSN